MNIPKLQYYLYIFILICLSTQCSKAVSDKSYLKMSNIGAFFTITLLNLIYGLPLHPMNLNESFEEFKKLRHRIQRRHLDKSFEDFKNLKELSPEKDTLEVSKFELMFPELYKQINTFGKNKRWHEIAINYLREFGYLTNSKPTPRELQNSIRAFQDMIGIKASGHLNAETIEQMSQPRCGNQDMTRGRDRRKRFGKNQNFFTIFLVYISRWENKIRDNVLRLKWFIQNYTKDIPRNDIKKTVRKAFHLWSSQVKINSIESLSLVFEEAATEAEADITIMWAEGDHGDAHKFDGPGHDGSNILAHTFYPNYQSKGNLNGDIHLDDFENWNVDGSQDGASFPHVLVHEIGHTLGLGHSKKQQAIMYPIYRKEQLDLMQLDLDDKCAINWSYVGGSDLCLYIWLLSEVLPKKIAIEKDTTFMIMDEKTVWDNADKTNEELMQKKLNNVRVPKCSPDNQVRTHLENMLVQRLSFSRTLAEEYGWK